MRPRSRKHGKGIAEIDDYASHFVANDAASFSKRGNSGEWRRKRVLLAARDFTLFLIAIGREQESQGSIHQTRFACSPVFTKSFQIDGFSMLLVFVH